MPSYQRSRRGTERNLACRRPFRCGIPLHRNADGEDTDAGATGCILQIFTPEGLDSASLVANQLGLGDRETGLHGNRHGIDTLGLDLLLQGKVLADGFEESGEVFLRQGFRVGYG